MKASIISLLFLTVIIGGCTAPENSTGLATEVNLPETAMTTTEFLEKVTAGGGGAGFVFAPEKSENQCHASTVASLGDGSLVCAWFWGSEEGESGVTAPGQVHALMRTQAGVIARADSGDYGQSWAAAYDSGLPNNNSGIFYKPAWSSNTNAKRGGNETKNRIFLYLHPDADFLSGFFPG